MQNFLFGGNAPVIPCRYMPDLSILHMIPYAFTWKNGYFNQKILEQKDFNISTQMHFAELSITPLLHTKLHSTVVKSVAHLNNLSRGFQNSRTERANIHK